jgi:hypothetical protein
MLLSGPKKPGVGKKVSCIKLKGFEFGRGRSSVHVCVALFTIMSDMDQKLKGLSQYLETASFAILFYYI